MTINNIDAVPNASGCNHVTIKCDVNGVTKQRVYVRSELLVALTPEEIETTILNCLRIHIKDSGLSNPSAIRSNLQAWSLTL